MNRIQVVERINEIADKYKFRNHFEIESQEVMDFCRGIMQAQHLGLNLDEEDLEFVQKILYGA